MNQAARDENERMFRTSIKNKLDRIIKLLENPSVADMYKQLTNLPDFPTLDGSIKCTCHKKGETTAAEYCPVHD